MLIYISGSKDTIKLPYISNLISFSLPCSHFSHRLIGNPYLYVFNLFHQFVNRKLVKQGLCQCNMRHSVAKYAPFYYALWKYRSFRALVSFIFNVYTKQRFRG